MKKGIALVAVFTVGFIISVGQAFCSVNGESEVQEMHSVCSGQLSPADLGDKVCEVNLHSNKRVASTEYNPAIKHDRGGHHKLTFLPSDTYTAVITNTGNQPLFFKIGYDTQKTRGCVKKVRMFGELSSGMVMPGQSQQVNELDFRGTTNKLFLENGTPKPNSRTCSGSLFNLFTPEFVGAEGTLTVYKKAGEAVTKE